MDMVRVHLDMELMQQHVVHAFTLMQAEQQAQVQKAVDEAFKHFNFESELQKLLKQEFERQMTMAIREAVSEALFGTNAKDEPLRTEFQKRVRDEVSATLRKQFNRG